MLREKKVQEKQGKISQVCLFYVAGLGQLDSVAVAVLELVCPPEFTLWHRISMREKILIYLHYVEEHQKHHMSV